ncbi:glycosyltransferase [Pseudomonas alloputida]|uniref:Glycosyl transferase n=2 Tax=Pseudomonas TaxID=286 RepID=A0ABD6MUN4_9PSED|nr:MULTISPECIES: glycosyltransferase [Pseudomonas]MBX6691333.1 glycosyltransferase [Pseudomonas sp. USTB-Z]NWL44939.1 glycosyl transferase [Pseudomonas hunanensis]TRZ60268.1 glycosyltransferase [Pseudomonas alloputida]
MPKCLVLLAAYNGVAYLGEQMQSILGQTAVDVDVLVSVDRSNDGTETWVEALTRAEPRVRMLDSGRQFGGAARNFFRLLDEACFDGYDYVAFADQDDLWYPDKLQRACQVLETRGVDGYSSDVLAYWPDGREALVRKSQPQVAHDHLFEAAGPGCTYVMTRALADAVKDSVQGHGEAMLDVALHDWYVYAFARAQGFKWFIDDRPCMRYRQHANNQVGVNSGFAAFKARVAKVFNGWWLGQSKLIAGLVGLQNDPFFIAWADLSRIGLIRLALECRACRRRPRDKFVFAVLCLGLAIRGGRR